MNKDNAAQYLPLVRALAEGKVIQVKSGHGDAPLWKDLEVCNFNVAPDLYRIKPEPREWWIVDREGVPALFMRWFDTENAAAEFIYSHGGRLVHVREVIA